MQNRSNLVILHNNAVAHPPIDRWAARLDDRLFAVHAALMLITPLAVFAGAWVGG